MFIGGRGAIRYECDAPPLFALNCHCRDCGSPVFGFPGARPDLVTIRAGSLDDPTWDPMDPSLPKTPRIG